jgi:hypothetical protein
VTSAPALASVRAVSIPMPDEPPVTIAPGSASAQALALLATTAAEEREPVGSFQTE